MKYFDRSCQKTLSILMGWKLSDKPVKMKEKAVFFFLLTDPVKIPATGVHKFQPRPHPLYFNSSSNSINSISLILTFSPGRAYITFYLISLHFLSLLNSRSGCPAPHEFAYNLEVIWVCSGSWPATTSVVEGGRRLQAQLKVSHGMTVAWLWMAWDAVAERW